MVWESKSSIVENAIASYRHFHWFSSNWKQFARICNSNWLFFPFSLYSFVFLSYVVWKIPHKQTHPTLSLSPLTLEKLHRTSIHFNSTWVQYVYSICLGNCRFQPMLASNIGKSHFIRKMYSSILKTYVAYVIEYIVSGVISITCCLLLPFNRS